MRLQDVDERLNDAFRRCGYFERSYYEVADGFAIASRIEQITLDGSPTANRWSLEVMEPEQFSLKAYVSALLRAKRLGHFRIIVFVVTPHPFSQSNLEVSAPEAMAWVTRGTNTLPEVIEARDYSSNYNCTALIYEFKGTGRGAEFVQPSEIAADTHLQKAGLLAALSRQQ